MNVPGVKKLTPVTMEYSKTNLLPRLDKEVKIENIYPIRLDKNRVIICARQGDTLIGYEYVPATATWINLWRKTVFNGENNYPLTQYPWLVTDVLGNDKDQVMLRDQEGISFYELLSSSPPELRLLAKDSRFHDVFGWNKPDHTLLWGRFYPNTNLTGVMTRDQQGVVKFYAVRKELVLANQRFPLWELQNKQSFTTAWNSADTDCYVTKLQRHSNQDMIGLRTTEGLEFYKFNANYLLNPVANISMAAKQTNSRHDYLFFADLTNRMNLDILHLNDSGLFIYQYNQQGYTFLHRHSEFTQPYGWLPRYGDSVQLADLNSDGSDDLLFTGPHGLTALTFDSTTNSWDMLLNPEQLLSGSLRYSNVIGTLAPIPPAILHPSVFTQDTEGNVLWVKVVQTTTTEAPTIGTVSTRTTSHPSRQRYALIPEQIARTSVLAEKPILRWVDQWDGSFLRESVDMASGQVSFSIPLIDISALIGWGLQLALSYNSQATTSDLLGVGWSLALAQDYISVDYQGSIYPEDAHYYLIAQGRPQRINLKSIDRGVQRFQFDEDETDEQMTIEYHSSEQLWIIEDATEQVIFGRAKFNAAQDALQYGLGGTIWRGPAINDGDVQPLVMSWYLNTRYDKQNKRVLYYYYEKDEASIPHGKKLYTAALRLKSISDDQQMQLVFDYSPKSPSEYTEPNPVDEQGNIIFPIPLAKSHYLKGYNITTATYSQTLYFIYQVHDGIRLLTGIEQQVFTDNESVLKFDYQTLLGKQILESCTLSPLGLTVKFTYESLTPPKPTFVQNVFTYPIRERAKIAYGQDYAVMAYRDQINGNKINLQIMNREMTKTSINCSVDGNLLNCPSVESKIKDYNLHAYRNSLVVVLETDERRELYIYNRTEQTWSPEPTTHSFGTKDLIYFDRLLIAAVRSDKGDIMLFECTGNQQSSWISTTLTVPSNRQITRLSLHNRLVVFWDDHDEMWLFYRDIQSHWHKKLLQSNLGISVSETLNRFDLDSEMRQNISTALNGRYGLQILNNFISLNELREYDGQLSFIVHLFLLDSQYNVVQKQSFTIWTRNLHQLSYEFKHENTTYILGYVLEDGRFKARINAIRGKIIEDMITKNRITNKNIKEDMIEKAIEDMNKQEGWLIFFKRSFLIDEQLYVQISHHGVYYGKDSLLRISGSGWQRETVPNVKSVRIGEHFILESDDKRSSYKLYKRDGNKNKPLVDLSLHSPGQLINRYPAYIAYQPTSNSVKVQTFKDDHTLGQAYTFYNEQLMFETDWQNLITIANASTSTMLHAEPQECLVRPVSTLVSSEPLLFVNQTIFVNENTQRLTGYERSFDNDQQESTYSETIVMIPGAEKNVYGWYEATRSYDLNSGNITKTELWFNANGLEVLGPYKEKSPEQDTTTSPESNPAHLLDLSGKWLISDFSPYSLSDEMGSYYGFESYENNLISAPVSDKGTKGKAWRFNQDRVIKRRFALTGENYLQLHGSTTGDKYIEGVFEPSNQDIIYLVACWIRCKTSSLTLNSPVSYLKAILSTTSGQEIIGLLAQVKLQRGDWYYLELPIDFQLVKQIYEEYIHYSKNVTANNIGLPSSEDVRFKITLRVEALPDYIVDLDHIRFSPLNHDFEATVYYPLTGKTTAVIQANGLVTRIIYNRLQQEIGSVDEDGQLTHFSSSSRTGQFVGKPQGSVVESKINILSFKPEYGSYEIFDEYALHSRWKLNNSSVWNIAPGQLWHKQSGRHSIEAEAHLFDSTSAAIRFYFALQDPKSSLSLNWKHIGSLQLTRQGNFITLAVPIIGLSITQLPAPADELIVLLEQNYMWLWLNGVLLIDQALPISKTSSSWSSFVIEAEGKVLIEDYLIMNRPQVKVEYYNAFGEKTQVIQLEDTQTAQITETLYDELGREAITTKTTRIQRTDLDQPLLAYRQHFVSNKNHNNSQSVWHTGKIEGEVDRLNPTDQGVSYVRIKYAPNPLNEKSILGLAGPDFLITGLYSTRLSQYSNIAFLSNLFPSNQGNRQRVEYTANGSLKVSVFDKHNNKVALYVRVPSYNHLLSTYEYDGENRLIKILPPLYHDKTGSASKLTSWQQGEEHLSAQEKHWQQVLSTRFAYDEYGRLIRKITPDSGVTKYLYNSEGLMRFMVSLDSGNQPERIVYFDYDVNGQLSKTGSLNQTLSIVNLRQYVNSQYLPIDAQVYQQLNYADDHLDPSLRGRIKHCITYNDDEPVIEKLQFNAQQQIVTKNTILTLSGQTGSDKLTEVKKEYSSENVHTLTYPITVDSQPLRVVHSYDRLGQLVALGTPDQPNRYATFTYLATGQLASELYQPITGHSFNRNYGYSSPGFLKRISDPFLTEEITYTEKGYGQAGYGDGMVMQTAFNASWPINADGRWFQLQENELGGNYSTVCVNALKRTGYLNGNGRPIKSYIRNLENKLPAGCKGRTGENIARIVAEKLVPRYYGHRYSYDSHQALTKAKYFTDDTKSLIEPLQADSFAKTIPGITVKDSQEIWHLLTNGTYVITDQQGSDSTTAIGKRGKSFFRDLDLQFDLAKLNDDYKIYTASIKQMIVASISQKHTISLSKFKTYFLYWTGVRDQESTDMLISQRQNAADRIYRMLSSKGYVPTQTADFTSALDENFTTILHQYADFIPDIVQVLSHHFAYELGETAFDVESYYIDSNGNHRLFRTGFDRYELDYRNNTNQVQSVKLNLPTLLERENIFAMKHDTHGNVVQALHRGIQLIEYHPVSQRTTRILLTDGRTLRFHYDAQGERVLKRVFNADGKINHETYYLRDEQGRVLVDKQIEYLPESAPKIIVTAYLYGPRGVILGFIRNEKFYSVTTDHIGSVRLVISEGKVVVAYDYLPYGQLMRSYGNDPHVHITYRYTGQEWDEETGLYNYHARFYDPSIGRFYQPDPKAQYFSPYKYAGNSPMSLVDPDGEVAFMVVLVFIGIGIYLGGAAANNIWNPLDWDIKDSGTWLGMIGGGIAGAFLPVGFGASVSAIGGVALTSVGLTASTATAVGVTVATGIGVTVTAGLGVGVAYLMTAADQGWNPVKWKWDRPGTYNAAFQGFGAGSGIAGGIGVMHGYAKSGKALTSLSKFFGVSRNTFKAIFLTTSYTVGGVMTYGAGIMSNNGKVAFWQWDWKNAATYSALVNGFDSGTGWTENFMQLARGIGKLGKHFKTLGGLANGVSKKLVMKSILKNPKHPLYKVTSSVVLAYFMGSSANGELDITKWNLSSFSTYEGILNGAFFGKDMTNMLKQARASKTKVPLTPPGLDLKKGIRIWSKKFINTVDSILVHLKRREYQRLMELSFSANTVLRPKNLPKTDAVEIFLKSGVKKWKNRESNPPKALQQLLLKQAGENVRSTSKELTELKTETEQLRKRQQEVFPDRDVEFLNCRRAARRRRRGTAINRKCEIVKLDDDFEKDPIEFLMKKAVTTWFIAARENKVKLENGKNYMFSFKVLSDNSGYSLYPKAKADIVTYAIANADADADAQTPLLLSGHNSGIHAYWLETKKSIEVTLDTHEGPDFIFTPELQGCSLYVKFNEQKNRMTVFHHFREFGLDGPGQKSLTRSEDGNKYVVKNDMGKIEQYDDVLSWETYGTNVQEGSTAAFATPMLYRDKNGEWFFVYQKISYDLTREKTNYLKNLKIKGLNRIPVRINGKQPLPMPKYVPPQNQPESVSRRLGRSLNLTENKSSLFNITPDFNPSDISTKDHPKAASSGASSIQFWPISLVKRLGAVISYYFLASFLWVSHPTAFSKGCLTLNKLPQAEHQPTIKPIGGAETGPSLVEMGDQWLKNTDIDGLLTWAILLARKWTGYRPTAAAVASNQSDDNGIELGIRSYILVNDFMNVTLNHAQDCGIGYHVSGVFQDCVLYCKAIETVRHKLAAGELESIPQSLYKLFVLENINDKKASRSIQVRVNKLSARLIYDIPNYFQQKLLQQEQEWLSYTLQNSVNSQSFNNISERADVSYQTIPASNMRQSDHLCCQRCPTTSIQS